MTDLPVWLQEIRDHAEEAQGPWWVTIARGASGGSMYEVTTAPWKHAPNVFPLSPASMEKLVSHPDVPRLIGLVGEMGEAIRDAAEVLQEHVEGESVLIERLWRLWKKYRWEEEP